MKQSRESENKARSECGVPTCLKARLLLDRFSKPHLLKCLGRAGEYIAIANLYGTVIIVNASGQVVRLETGMDILDIALLDTTEIALMALATSQGVLLFDFDWNNPPSFSVTQHATRLEGHDGRATGVVIFPGTRPPRESQVVTAYDSQPFVVSADERGNIHRWGDRGYRHMGTVRAHRKTVHYIHASMTQDGQPVVVTASDDREVVMHRLDSQQAYARLNAHVGWIEQVLAVELGGVLEHLVVTDRVGTIVWNVQDQRVISRFRGRPRTDVAVSRDPMSGVIVAVGTDEGVIIAHRSRLQPVRSGMFRAVSLSSGGSSPIVWLAIDDRLCRYEVEGGALQGRYQFPANILRLKAWKSESKMLSLLENGSIWMMEC